MNNDHKSKQKKTTLFNTDDLLYTNALDKDFKYPLSETNPYLTDYNSKVKYNPKHIKREIIALNIDSRFRQDKTQSTSDFLFIIPDTIKNVVKLRLSSVELPNTYYKFDDEYNNTKFIIIDQNDVEHEVIITSGNYSTTTQFMTELNTQMPNNFTATLNNINQKITISSDDSSTFQLNLNPCKIPRDTHFGLGYLLGYRNKTYVGEQSYTTESVLDINGSTYMFIEVNDFNLGDSNPVVSYTENSIVNTKILGKILIRNSKTDITFDDDSDFLERLRIYRTPVNIQRFRIRLLNEFGNVVSLNGIDFSITLEACVIIDRDSAIEY